MPIGGNSICRPEIVTRVKSSSGLSRGVNREVDRHVARKILRKIVVAIWYSLVAAFGHASIAQADDFSEFVRDFAQVAQQNGVSAQTYQRAMAGVTFDPNLAQRISGQPEFTTPIWDYLDRRVSSSRIARGQKAFRQNEQLIRSIADRSGVDPFVLTAIWGIETDFGAVLGNKNLIKPIVPSLTNLVFARRGRVALDQAELIGALQLLQRSGVVPQVLIGSWAGAMGHLQVNPTVLRDHGVDGDGDGRLDVHASLADALATSANLLISFGYRSGVDWGFEVELPNGFDLSLATRNVLRPISFFAQRGVRRVANRQFADLSEPVFLYLPAGASGPKFLMTKNYLTFKDYNFSDSYAMSVAHLTDRLKGSGPFVQPWPRQTKFPNLAQRREIQTWLTQLGYYADTIDGRLGPISQEAYQKFQVRLGLPADGFITAQSHRLLKEAVGG